MNRADLKSKTQRGLFWSFVDNAGVLVSQFIIGIILARILLPEDFGIIGMIMVFITLGQFLMNSGFAQALIQKKDSDETDFSTVFIFNIASSLFIWLIFYFIAPLIADFYNEPALTPITRVISLSFVINSFGFLHQTWLTKQVEFKAQSLVGITGTLLSGVIAIIMAYMGFSYWSIVAQYLIKNLVTSVMLWMVSKWRPNMKFSWNSLRVLFKYSSQILIGGLVATIFSNIYYIVIGRFFNATILGYYTRSNQFKDLPVLTINSFVQKVTYPVFSKIQDDEEKLVSGLRQISRFLSAISIPLMAIMILIAKPFILILLTEKWLPSVIYLQLLSSFGWIFLLQFIYIQIDTVKGRSDYYMQYQIIDKILILIAILFTYSKGIYALIGGQFVATIISYFVSVYYLKKVITIKVIQLIADILPFLFVSLCMFVIIFFIIRLTDSNIGQLFIGIFASPILYFLLLKLFRIKEADMAIQFLREKLFKPEIKSI